MKFRHALGEVLREIRHEQKLNLRDVAREGKVAVGYLSEIERGRKEVSSEILESIAKALGVPIYQLIKIVAWKIELNSSDFQNNLELDEQLLNQ